MTNKLYPHTILATDDTWEQFIKKKEESGLTWNQFIQELLNK